MTSSQHEQLIDAIKNSDISKLSSQLYVGADPNGRDADGMTPLHYAASMGGRDYVFMLLDNGADVNATDKHGNTSLLYAARKGASRAVDELLKAGADINHKNNAGITALHCAAETGNAHTTGVLLRAGADIEVKEENGLTACEKAIIAKHEHVLFAFNAHDARMNERAFILESKAHKLMRRRVRMMAKSGPQLS